VLVRFDARPPCVGPGGPHLLYVAGVDLPWREDVQEIQVIEQATGPVVDVDFDVRPALTEALGRRAEGPAAACQR